MLRTLCIALLFFSCKTTVPKNSIPPETTSPSATPFSRADSLRGTLNANRSWWDVQHYDITVEPDFAGRKIIGKTTITYTATGNSNTMQIDLQQPLVIDSIKTGDGGILSFEREGNTALVQKAPNRKNGNSITIFYNGIPREAKTPPWDGGWIWKTDSLGRPWMSVACQGLGASVWFPCKDHQSDEPDLGARLNIIAPNDLTAVGNGRLISKTGVANKTNWTWEVKNPINSYNIIPSIGHYVHFGNDYSGLKGQLPVEFWVLDYELERARIHFQQTYSMLSCFEEWFGPYPFYEDGFKLISSPHLGMEHQSAVAYGNKFMNGYLGRDLSRSGWGLKFDFIIIHESGHEWFGNSITTRDIADMWVHEGFTNYTEVIYTTCGFGVQAGNEYAQGLRRILRNDRPIIGQYGVQNEGSGDMYAKGALLVHTIRTLIDDDSVFKALLREMNKRFRHSTVTTQQIEDFLQSKTSQDLRPLFDQFLRESSIPVLETKKVHDGLELRFTNCRQDFKMPVFINTLQRDQWFSVSTSWKKVPGKISESDLQNAKNKNLLFQFAAVEN